MKKFFVGLFTILCLLINSFIPAFATNYSYDSNGNLLSDGTTCYVYNEANQLSQVKNCSSGQVSAQYAYDYNGNRIAKKLYTNGSLQKTVYSPTDSYETVKNVSGTTQNSSYYFANDQIIAKKNPDGTKVYFQDDNLGSASLITNQSGALVEETTYDPWGSVLSGGVQSKFQYTGQEKDQETGLNYYNYRYYNSDTRHFTQPDDIYPDTYDPQSLNRYSYVRNNPLKYTDPTGHCPQCIIFLGGSLTLLTLEAGGGVYGAVTAPNTTLVGRFQGAAVGMQKAVESPAGELAFGAATLGVGIAAESPVGSTNSINSVGEESAVGSGLRSENVLSKSVNNVKQVLNTKMEIKGGELVVGKSFRVSMGNLSATNSDGSPNIAARLPHYHLKQSPQVDNPVARTSINWHRPWQTVFRRFFK